MDWMMRSRTLQIVCSGWSTLPLGRAPPSYPPTPTPSSRQTPGPMVADRIVMGDIIGSTVTVGPGVRRDDGRGWVGLCGWTGRGRTANCELRQHPSPRSNSTVGPSLHLRHLACIFNSRAATQRGRRWIATDALSNLLQMRNLAWPDRGKAPVVGRRWNAAERARHLDSHLAFAKCEWACPAPPSRLP